MYVFKINRKLTIFTALLLAVIVLCFSLPVAFASKPIKKYTIVIDAGHGGIDGGSIGVTSGIEEAKLNLEYAKCLRDYFESFDFNVVMTRSTDSGLYNVFAKNRKKDDMTKRKEIIETSNADVVISIHMNSHTLKSSKGCQVFYAKGNEAGMALANSVQNQLISDMDNAKKSSSVGDYYILNCTNIPSILIECGFLSNPEEDELLQTDDYKTKICYSVFCGIVSYFGVENI